MRCFMSSMWCLCAILIAIPSQAQERSPAPPEEELIVDDGSTSVAASISSSRDNEDDVIERTSYTLVNRKLEIGLLQGVGGGLAMAPLIRWAWIALDIMRFDEVSYESHLESMFPTALFVVSASVLSTYGLGRANGSRAHLGSTILSSMGGATVGTLIGAYLVSSSYGPLTGDTWLEWAPVERPWRWGAGYAIYFTMPFVGAILGYQLSSNWNSGENRVGKSPALSFGVMPTREGAVGSLGFSF